MKKDKQYTKEVLSEALLEIVLTLICFGIGAFIVRLFGVEIDSSDVDFDLLILLGIIAIIVSFGIVYALIRWIKKKLKDDTRDKTS